MRMDRTMATTKCMLTIDATRERGPNDRALRKAKYPAKLRTPIATPNTKVPLRSLFAVVVRNRFPRPAEARVPMVYTRVRKATLFTYIAAYLLDIDARALANRQMAR